MRRTVFAVAALAMTVVPAAAEDYYGGHACDYTDVTDPQPGDLNHRAMLLTSGPVFAASAPPGDTAGPGTAVTVTCEVQLNDDDPTAGNVATATSPTGVGATMVPPTQVMFNATSTDRIYVCTRVQWTDSDGDDHDEYFDVNAGQAGPQCQDFTDNDPLG